MSRLRLKISMSLDGFVAGPSQSIDNPLGIGGERLHEWVVVLSAWRAEHGKQGGQVNESSAVVEESIANLGATTMGRNMFAGHPGGWDARNPWQGWWGDEPPFHHPVFVLTHHERKPLVLKGGTTFTFVTEGHRDCARARSPGRGQPGHRAGRRCAGGAAVSRRLAGGRNADSPRADAARRW